MKNKINKLNLPKQKIKYKLKINARYVLITAWILRMSKQARYMRGYVNVYELISITLKYFK